VPLLSFSHPLSDNVSERTTTQQWDLTCESTHIFEVVAMYVCDVSKKAAPPLTLSGISYICRSHVDAMLLVHGRGEEMD